MNAADDFSALHTLSLEGLLTLARRVDLIDGYVRTGERLTLRLGVAALDFVEDQAVLYLQGLLRGHAETLGALQEAPDGAEAPARSQVERERVLLMVDDDEEDCLIVRSAVLRLKPALRFECVNSGEELATYLGGSRNGAPPLAPDLILLDINMPVRNGIEVLQDLRASPEFSHIPVIMLTTSTAEADVYRSAVAGSNAFATKPKSRAEMDHLLRAITQYWLPTDRLPES